MGGKGKTKRASHADDVIEQEAHLKRRKVEKNVENQAEDQNDERTTAILERIESLDDKFFQAVTGSVIHWYHGRKRDLPWRKDHKNAYGVLVSEIMLQQTRVSVVIPYWEKWMAKWPTVRALGEELSEETVMSHWAGLGYYSRARNLWALGKYCVEKCNGELPQNKAGLLKLPGVGPYTASAVASICFDEPVGVVDGNVARVLHRVFGVSGPSVIQPWLWRVMDSLASVKLPKPKGARNRELSGSGSLADIEDAGVASIPRNLNQSVMEVGALVCLPDNPSCSECPLQNVCEASAKNPAEYGRKATKK